MQLLELVLQEALQRKVYTRSHGPPRTGSTGCIVGYIIDVPSKLIWDTKSRYNRYNVTSF